MARVYQVKNMIMYLNLFTKLIKEEQTQNLV